MTASNIIQVDDVGPADGPALQALLAEAELPKAELGRPGTCYLKLSAPNGTIVGFAGLELCGRDALLRSVVVRPEKRRHGAGRAVVETALARAADLGISTVYLLTTTARDFFAHLGFAVIPRERVPASIARTSEFASLCPETAVCMRKELRRGR